VDGSIAPLQTVMVVVLSSSPPGSGWPDEASGDGGVDAEDTILRHGE
jgi:hypothetical protein